MLLTVVQCRLFMLNERVPQKTRKLCNQYIHCIHQSAISNKDTNPFGSSFRSYQLTLWQLVLDFPFITARCTLVQSAVLRSHVVCLSVRPSVRLSVTLVDCDDIGWNSSKIISPLVSPGCSLFATPTWGVCSKRNTPKFGPKVTYPCWFERQRHSIANCGRIVTDSATVTMESL